MSTIDVRGFHYALDPLLRRQRWRLEAQQLKLAASQRDIASATASQQALEDACRQRADECARALAGRFDLAGHQRQLAYLTQLRGTIAAGAETLAGHHQQAVALRALCLRLQRRLDLLTQHRDAAVAVYRQAEQHRHGGEMDREWISRGVWRALSTDQVEA